MEDKKKRAERNRRYYLKKKQASYLNDHPNKTKTEYDIFLEQFAKKEKYRYLADWLMKRLQKGK